MTFAQNQDPKATQQPPPSTSSTKMLKKVVKQSLFSIRRTTLQLNTRWRGYKNTLWLIGDGRSGTTWAASLLNHNKTFRELFEPFHPFHIKQFKDYRPYHYIAPENRDPDHFSAFQRIFSGNIYHPRIDADNKQLFYDGLLIKDIFSNLYAKWACQNFPHVKPVLMLRNPIEVAQSKMKTKHWFWPTDLEALFLADDALREDHLAPFTKTIESINRQEDLFLKHILVWCVINRVLIHQFQGDIATIHYEDLKANPQACITETFKKLGINSTRKISHSTLVKPSKVTYRSDKQNQPVSEERNRTALALLQEFQLCHLYGNNWKRYA